jgi:hypothetical protein
MSRVQEKKRIIGLLTMSKKKIHSLDEEQLISTIQDVDYIKQQSVKEGRFLGKLTRR